MRQYLDVKARYPDAIVFFRLGDFYEMFYEDAVYVARVLDLTLTTRDKGKEDPVPMCGVPHHAVRTYLAKLTELGHRVALCEQLEDPKVARGIVKRDVVRVVTPGVVLDEESLDPRAPSYVAAAVGDARAGYGLAFLDVTTGRLSGHGGAHARGAARRAGRAEPRELVLGRGDREGLLAERDPDGVPAPAARRRQRRGDRARAVARAGRPVRRDAAGARAASRARAAAAVLRYARATQPGAELALGGLEVVRRADTLVIDEQARAHLELVETLQERRRAGSLIDVIDETRSAMGGRLLRRWLLFPSLDVAAIRRRQDAVERLVGAHAARDEARKRLGEIADLERLVGRARLGVATPRDLAVLGRSLGELPALAAALDEAHRGEIGAPAGWRAGLAGAGRRSGDRPGVRADARAAPRRAGADQGRRLRQRRRLGRAGRAARHRQRRPRPHRRDRDARARAHRHRLAEGQATTASSATTSRSRARTWRRCRPTTAASRRSPTPSASSRPSWPSSRPRS